MRMRVLIRLCSTLTELEDRNKGISKILNRTDGISYTRLFPTAYISYKYNYDNIFNLSYSRRIDRPSFWELNPFRFYLNPNSYAEGNPYLLPSIDNNVKLYIPRVHLGQVNFKIVYRPTKHKFIET